MTQIYSEVQNQFHEAKVEVLAGLASSEGRRREFHWGLQGPCNHLGWK